MIELLGMETKRVGSAIDDEWSLLGVTSIIVEEAGNIKIFEIGVLYRLERSTPTTG